MSQLEVIEGVDGIKRCAWGAEPEIYRHYHDKEWGQPVIDDNRLFEKICLEGFQSGLSWLTILKKRDHFRKVFKNFDFKKIAKFTPDDMEALVHDPGIIRHRGKIEATVSNAKQALALVEEFGSIGAYIWQWGDSAMQEHLESKQHLPASTETSKALSKDLKKRGWKFFGPTTAYAFMQAMGLINDHHPSCSCYSNIEQLRKNFVVPSKHS